MKNLNKILIAFIAILIVSCTADAVDNRPIIESISAPELVTPENNTAFVLTEANAANVADTVTWTKAKYSNTVVVEYTVLMDLKGGDFTNAIALGTTSDTNKLAVLVKNLNQVAIELGAVPGEATPFDIKVKSSVSGAVVMVSETLITISVNAYSGLVAYDFTDWYLIGSAVYGGWDNNTTTKHQPLFRSATNAKEYKFTGYFMAGEFKFISTLGSWLPQLGKGADNSSIAIKSLDSQGDPGTFLIATAGYYTFTMNTETLAASLVAYNASAATTYTTVGVIGSSTPLGWDGSTAMTQSSFNAHVWSLGVSLNDGAAKFRANNAWDVSWGGDKAFSGYPGNGTSGGDIPVSKSKYKIFFNDLDGSYLMIPNQE